MNQQPEPYVGSFVALIIFAVFVYYFIKAYNDDVVQKTKVSDLFTLGYLEDQPIQVINVQNNGLDVQLYNDCIDALHALGMKKSEAKKKTKFIFSNYSPAPKTVQEFLVIALKI